MEERFRFKLIMRFIFQDLEMDQLDDLPRHGLNLLNGVHPVVRPDRDPVRHLLLHLALLVLVALLLHLQREVMWEAKIRNDKRIPVKSKS